jgi:hypothetical protein
MPLRIEASVDGVFVDLWDWARARSESEGLELADWVNRLIDVERRRVEGLARLDPRTIHPGQRGAGVQVRPGEIGSLDLARLTGAREKHQITRWRQGGLIQTVRETRQGIVATYAHQEVVICFVLMCLEALLAATDERLEVAAKLVRAHWDDRGHFRGAFLTMAGDDLRVVGQDFGVGNMRTPAGVVYNLEAIEAELDRRARG